MTPHEKSLHAINRRLERLQASLRATDDVPAQSFLLQAVFGTLAMAEALNDYIKEVGNYARRRHAELKQTNDALAAQHADLLKTGHVLLEKFKAHPTDQALHRELEAAQQSMAAVQKTLRRGANSLQRDVAPGVAMIDPLAESLRRLADAEQLDALKRTIRSLVAQVGELYARQPNLSARSVVDASAWEATATAELDQAAGFQDAYARTTYQAILALELMTMAVIENPPASAEEATTRAGKAVTARLKAVASRFGDESGPTTLPAATDS